MTKRYKRPRSVLYDDAKLDVYINVFHCDGCSKKFSDDETWLTCGQCSLENYFSSFDLCKEVNMQMIKFIAVFNYPLYNSAMMRMM